jgi:hypothetical protein
MKMHAPVSSMRIIVAILALTIFSASRAQAPVCENCALVALQSSVPDVNAALSIIDSCLQNVESSAFQHFDATDNDYCRDNPASVQALRLANLELRLAALEGNMGTFCCSASECKANCPEDSSVLLPTCDCTNNAPHQPALLTTLDPVTRIKNLANRVPAVGLEFGLPCPSDCGGGNLP